MIEYINKETFDKIKELIRNYEIDVPEKLMGMLIYKIEDVNPYYEEIVQIAQFLKFIRLCDNSNLQLKGIVNSPIADYIKGQDIKIDFNDELCINFIELLLHKLLYIKGGFIFEDNWNDRNPIDWE